MKVARCIHRAGFLFPMQHALAGSSLQRLIFVASALGFAACADARQDQIMSPPAPPKTSMISADPSIATNLTVSFQDASADSVRAEYQSADGTESGVTPWFASSKGTLPILGLRAATQYAITLQSRRGSNIVNGGTATETTPALPVALQGVSMSLVSGTLPSRGYTLTSLIASDGNGYAVAFDSTGTLRWYRNVGAHDVMETKQQRNGNVTIYVGSSKGYDPIPGAYVEVTPEGDSVRTIMASGSPFTDPHELIEAFDRTGNRVADYVFGYDLENFDLTSKGGASSVELASHQVLRISAAGEVDTLVNGSKQWAPSDDADPASPADLDHPNAMTFDRDGQPIISYRDIDAIIKVDSVSRAVLWQLGGIRNQFTFVNDPLGGFSGQHSVRVLPNGDLLMLDNGTEHSPTQSRIVEYALNPTAKTATMVWEYIPAPSLFNEFTGTAQRLSNGNTVAGWTKFGLVDEVSPSSTLVSRMQVWSAPGTRAVHSYRFMRIESLYGYADP